jgi:hypothetical protein
MRRRRGRGSDRDYSQRRASAGSAEAARRPGSVLHGQEPPFLQPEPKRPHANRHRPAFAEQEISGHRPRSHASGCCRSLRFSLSCRSSKPEAGDREQGRDRTVGWAGTTPHGEGRPEARASIREVELGRRHPDDRVQPIVDHDASTDGRGIASKVLAPETVAQYDDLVRSLGLFLGAEEAARRRPSAQHREQIVRNRRSVDSQWLVEPDDRVAAAAVSGHGVDRPSRLAPGVESQVAQAAPAQGGSCARMHL